jgi:hypothetical protein
MRCSSGKCVCLHGYKWDKKWKHCEYEDDFSENWAHYLWFLIIIPITIVALIIYFVCLRRKIKPEAVFISHTRTIAQQYEQQYPIAPPPYTEQNTFK